MKNVDERIFIGRVCGWKDCSRERSANGYCHMHYLRDKRGAPMDAPVQIHDNDRGCSIEGCEEKYFANGYCSLHYSRDKNDRDMDAPRQIYDSSQGCKHFRCEENHFANGYCSMHYQRERNGWDMDAPKHIQDSSQGCKHSGCEEKHSANGYCSLHYDRNRNGWDMDAPKRIQDGSGYINGKGYRILYRPDHPNAAAGGKIFEHVVVMVEKEGRPLRDGENVHHKNGIRDDNDPENLELWSTSQPSGQRIEDKIEWCEWFLSQYKPDALAK